MSRDIIFDPGAFSPRELTALKKNRSRLAALTESARTDCTRDSRLVVSLLDGEKQEALDLPQSLVQVLAAALTNVADGHAVCLTPIAKELTTQQAADLLNVSRPFFVRLLNESKISYRTVGAHRRVMLADVLAYKAKMYRKAEAAFQELTDQAQDLGLGYE